METESSDSSSCSSDSEEFGVRRRVCRRVVMNVSMTQYEVVRNVGKKAFNWKLSMDSESDDWDVFWTDSAVQPERLARMKSYQKINHFPGMYELSMKNHLARNLNKLRKLYPEEYSFFPRTWLIPAELGDFRAQFTKKPVKTYIMKPEASCQGRGIFLMKDFKDLEAGARYVAQEYIKKPYLIDDLKFDLRIYVLVAGCDPLRIFVHEDGLGRFATEEYVLPRRSNMGDMCMHLTNYAINKDNPNFVYNEDSEEDDLGHKRSLASVYETLKSEGVDVAKLKQEIAALIIKTLCTAQPILAHTYKSCQPEDITNGMCFEVLGFDVLLDEHCKPWLLEVNHTPSFTTDTPLDKKIKFKVIKDSLEIMNIAYRHRNNYFIRQRAQLQRRAVTGKLLKDTKEKREELIGTARSRRDQYETKHLNGFTKIYPAEDSAIYDHFITSAKCIWEEWTGARISRLKREDVKSPTRKFDFSKPRVLPVKVRNEAMVAAAQRMRKSVQSASETTRDSSAPELDKEISPSRPLLNREKLDIGPIAYMPQEETRSSAGGYGEPFNFTIPYKLERSSGGTLVQRMNEALKRIKGQDEGKRDHRSTSIQRLPSEPRFSFPTISSSIGNYVKPTVMEFDLKSGLSIGTRFKRRL